MKSNKPNISTLGSFLVFTLLPVFSSGFLGYFVLKYNQDISNFNSPEWLLVSLLLALSSALAITPPTFLAIVFGYFLKLKALPYLLIINIGAILLVYLLSRILDFGWLKTYLKTNTKAHEISEKIKKEEVKIIFFTKLSPVLPFAITNLVFAASGAKLKNIIWGGFLGMIPRTILAIYSGMQAIELKKIIENPSSGGYHNLFIFALVLISVWGIIFTLNKTKK